MADNNTKKQIDEIDKQIIFELQTDARQTSRQIAKKLGIAHTTVQRRIKRLLDEQLIQIVAVPNWVALGYQVWAQIDLKVKHGFSEKVATAMLQFHECYFITESLGPSDVIIAARFKSMAELIDFLTKKLPRTKGIESTQTSLHIRPHRYYDFKWL